MDVFSTALSGLRAADTRIAVSANNIVNQRTPNFKPADAIQESVDNGGVIVDIRGRQPASVETADGPVPNVSLEQEVVNTITAESDFKANLLLIKKQKEMDKSLLDIQA